MVDVTEETALIAYQPTWACRVSSETDPVHGAMPPILKSDLSTILLPRKVGVYAGGHRMDYAEVEFILSGPILDQDQPAEFTKMVDVLMPTSDSEREVGEDGSFDFETSNKRVFLGDFLAQLDTVNSGGESINGQVQMRPNLYGIPFGGVKWWDVRESEFVEISGTDAMFNPNIDGTVMPNRSDKKIPDDDQETTYGWTDAEVGVNAFSMTYHDQIPSMFTLKDAVASVMWTCNPDEVFIRNARNADLAVLDDAPPVEDVIIEGGRYLPFYLDALLHPVGYNWTTDYDQEPEEETETNLEYERPKIRVFKKGVGDEVYLNWQRPDAVLVLATGNDAASTGSDINQYVLARNIGDSVNRIRIWGDYIRAEVTVPLYPAWPAGDDELTAEDLDKSAEGSVYQLHRDAHRRWVANESGEWFGLRTGTFYPIPEDPPDFSAIFALPEYVGAEEAERVHTTTIPIRRKMEGPLTYTGTSDNPSRRDLHLEFSLEGPTWAEVIAGGEEALAAEAAREWMQWRISDDADGNTGLGSWSVMADQIGIEFNNQRPPIDADDYLEAWEAGKLRLRITGTIVSDHRLHNDEAEQTAGVSANARENILDLHLHQKYRYWFVVKEGIEDRPELAESKYKSVLAGEEAGADEHDDREAMNEYAIALVTQAQNAEYDLDAGLPGWHTNLKIGDLLVKINGRNISLNQSVDDEQPAYCQIVGLEYVFDDQMGPMTFLLVDRGTKYVSDVNTRRKRRVTDGENKQFVD